MMFDAGRGFVASCLLVYNVGTVLQIPDCKKISKATYIYNVNVQSDGLSLNSEYRAQQISCSVDGAPTEWGLFEQTLRPIQQENIFYKTEYVISYVIR